MSWFSTRWLDCSTNFPTIELPQEPSFCTHFLGICVCVLPCHPNIMRAFFQRKWVWKLPLRYQDRSIGDSHQMKHRWRQLVFVKVAVSGVVCSVSHFQRYYVSVLRDIVWLRTGAIKCVSVAMPSPRSWHSARNAVGHILRKVQCRVA